VQCDVCVKNVMSQCIAVCYSVLQWVAVCCSVLQCVAVCALCCSVLQRVAVRGSCDANRHKRGLTNERTCAGKAPATLCNTHRYDIIEEHTCACAAPADMSASMAICVYQWQYGCIHCNMNVPMAMCVSSMAI